MNLKQYIAETERKYNYRLKSVEPLDDDAMDRIERVAMKYQPIDISRPKKTMMQSNPLDFPNVDSAEVWIVDLEFGLPASPYVIAREIHFALDCPEKFIVVLGLNDPSAIETGRLNAEQEMKDEAEKLGLKPSGLLNDPTYSEVTTPTDLYGKVHNQKFLDALRTVQKERDEKSKIDAPNPLFKWMDMPDQEKTDEGLYNADIPDAPSLGKAGKPSKEPISGVSNSGALTDHARTYKRQYGKNGERTMLSREVDTAKDPK